MAQRKLGQGLFRDLCTDDDIVLNASLNFNSKAQKQYKSSHILIKVKLKLTV